MARFAHRAALVALLLPAASLAHAADLHVAPGASIQAAIQAAAPGDRVLVAAGTYHERLDFLGKPIEVIGVLGAGATVLDADFAGIAVSFLNGEGAGSVLRGFTVTGGSGGFGPGGVVTNGAPLLEGCIIENNRGRLGAGVHGNATLVDCVVRGNISSLNHGGGLWGAPHLVRCQVEGNTANAADGGGLYVTGGAALLEDCRIVRNRSAQTGGKGGGICVHSSGSVTLVRCVIAGNHASAGLFTAAGGGVFAGGPTTLDRCTLADNTLSGNTEQGAAVWGAATITNSIVWGHAPDPLVGVASVAYCDVEGGAPGPGNIDLDPLLWAPSLLDFQLQPGSPCIDAADPGAAPDPDGSRADMGARPFAATYVAPSTYCVGAPNSVGAGARIGHTGGASLGASDLVVRVSAAPPVAFGLFFMGSAPAMTPLGDGFLCVGGSLARFPVVRTNTLGDAAWAVDAGGLGIPAGLPVAFQFWYRDAGGPGGTGSNLSDALAVTFAP